MNRMGKSVFAGGLMWLCVAVVQGQAQTLVWTGNVNNVWNTADPNWLNAGVAASYADGNAVVFDDTALVVTNINISGTVSPGSLLFSNTTAKAYSFTNGAIAGGGSISKTGSGVVTFGSTAGGGLSGASPLSLSAGTLISGAQGALGTGAITFNRSAAVDRILKFDAVSQIFANSIIISGETGGAKWDANNNVSFTGAVDFGTKGASNPLTFQGKSSLELNLSNKLSLGGMTNYWLIGAADGNNPAVSIPLGVNLPAEISVKINGGAFVLSPNMTWSQFAANHTFTNTTPAVGQWSLNGDVPEKNGGFAARGTPQVIDAGSGGFSNVIKNSHFILGSAVTNADGTFFANAPVEISAPMVFSSNADREIHIANNGPGFGAMSSSNVVQKISGSISGPGALRFKGRGGSVLDALSANAEVVLSGENSWTGGLLTGAGDAIKIYTGPGSLGIGPRTSAIIRFSGNSSLPSGNSGRPAYLWCMTITTDAHQQGFMLTGITNGNSVYQLPDAYKFLLQGGGNSKPIFGSAEGHATLKGSDIAPWGYSSSNSINLYLLIRDGSLTLGAAGEPVWLISSTCSLTNLSSGWSSADATPLLDRTNTTTLIKRGDGTLVLHDVRYTKVDKVTDASSRYIWRVGDGALFKGMAFNGVVREMGSDSTNSLRGMLYTMNGGILGLSADYAGVAGTNTPAGEINIGNHENVYGYVNLGSGFGAYGGKRTVTLMPKSGNKFTWGSTAVASDYFVFNGAPMIFNAPDADGEIVLASAETNYISLNSAARTITVYDNPATNSDWATLSIPIIDANANAALIKFGNGILNLSATNNNWAGVTSVSNGTLNVNGALLESANTLTVYSGAALGGTGTVSRPVQVLSGGTLSAGTPTGTGSLNISSNLVLNSGATLAINVDAAGYDRVIVGGTGSIDLTGVKVEVIPASGSDVTSTYTILTSGSTLSNFESLGTVTRGYNVRLSAGGTALELRKDSSGLVIRVQ
jgi:autotransporter-associated beta strand protein